MNTLDLYYHLRPFIPRPLQIAMRRHVARRKRPSVTGCWPILESAGTPPDGWQGWPDDKAFALVLTHDVETQIGHDKCRPIMDLEERLGFRSSFNLVPERYRVDTELRAEMVARGFEVGVHGLVHDGHLFKSRRVFDKRCSKINGYLKDWNAVGFRSPSTRRNLKWIGELDIAYDSSTFDTDPFEPESDGVGTIFPTIIDYPPNGRPYVELPYTVPQDSTLFIILGEDSPRIWKAKIEWIARQGGMVLINTHPDYMHMDGHPGTGMTYPGSIYQECLDYVTETYGGRFWHPLPRELADWVLKAPARVNRRTLRRSCMVAYAFYDSDNRVRRYAETLARRGDDVEAFGLRLPGAPATGMLNGVEVSRIQARKRDERGQLGYLMRILRFSIKSSAILAWRHRQRPYDLIHVHSVPDFEVFAAWFPKLFGATVMLDIHDIVPEFYASKFGVDHQSAVFRALKRIERASCSFADHVISANHLWHEVLTQRAVATDNCTVFLNYVDKTIFYPRPRTRTDNRFILIYPGGLQTHQGLDVAIRAMPAIRRDIPNAEFHIYGDGDQKDALLDLIEALHLTPTVFLHRAVPLQDVPELMANADIGIVPKLAESFGNEAYSTKILEFMSQGLPVVVSRTKIDSYYFDDTIVRFFDSGDSAGLATAVIDLAGDPAARRSLAGNASAYLLTQFWDQREQVYLDLIDRLRARSQEEDTRCN